MTSLTRRIQEMVRHFPENGMKFLLENAGTVRELLALTDTELLAWIDWTAMKVDRTTYVQRDYRHVEADVVLYAPLRVPGSRRRRQVLIYVLIEHQSEPDRWMLLRVLEYVVQIYKAQLRTQQRRRGATAEQNLHPVLPVVFYTGDAPWPRLGAFTDLVELGDRMQTFGPTLSPLFINLGTLPAERLESAGGFLGWVLRLVQQRYARPAEFQELLGRAVRHLEGLSATEWTRWRELLTYLRALVYHVREEPEHEELYDLIATSAETDRSRREIATMGRTIAEALKAAGEKKGLQKGLEQGLQKGRKQEALASRRETLLLLLRERFEDVPASVLETVRDTTDVEQIKTWLKRFAVAKSLDEVGIGSD